MSSSTSAPTQGTPTNGGPIQDTASDTGPTQSTAPGHGPTNGAVQGASPVNGTTQRAGTNYGPAQGNGAINGPAHGSAGANGSDNGRPPGPRRPLGALRRLPPLALLGLLLAGSVALFLGWDLSGPVGFILSLRVTKLVALVLVGAAVGMATVLFQTLAGSRLLTPGIVGFDALFVFLQTLLILTLGGLGYTTLPPMAKFLAETAILVAAALLLFGLLLKDGARDMTRMILAGVILGVLLRGLAGLGQRLMDPSEFAVVQQASFVSFTSVPEDQLAIAAVVLAVAAGLALRLAGRMDVAALGERTARSLGLAYRRTALQALALVAAMAAVSTALVGPITFLGLLAASLAHHLAGTHRHAILLPAAGLIGATILVFGQFVFERLLSMQSSLALLVEFAGGLLFLALVLRRQR